MTLNNQLLWFTTRGAGMISLVLLSAVMALGVLAQSRFGSRRWPRFLTPALHRNLSLTAVIFLGIHIVTAVVDPFTHLGLVAAVVPFGSYYRTLWLGLGTLAFELMVAVIATSFIRHLLGARVWRGIHFLSYPLWLIAVMHGLGTGTDAGFVWMRAITGACIGLVAVATAACLWNGSRDPLAAGRGELAARFGGAQS